MHNGLVTESKTPRVLPPGSTAGSKSRHVYDAEAFRSVLNYERARTERSGQAFSLVAFELRSDDRSHAQADMIVDYLCGRLRATDEIGWLDARRVAALLPYTPVSGGWKVADDLVASLPTDSEPPLCEVFCYPTQWKRDVVGDIDEPDEPQEPQGRPPSSLMPHFAQPMPLWKRLLDVFGAGLGLVLLLPLFALVALVQKVTSPGPLLFRQRRMGWGGRPFQMLKFRTMIVNAEAQRSELLTLNEQDGPAFKIQNDPRVTPFGRFLRKTSIDELPQLWNVLRGEMSLVGPRPLPCFEAEACEAWQQRRHDVTPGLTCLWQVYGRSRCKFDDWMRLDLRYAAARSLWRDLKLILLTIPAVLWRRGAH